MGAYATSKLANLLFTYELHRRLAARGARIAVNALHPGLVATRLGRDNGWLRVALRNLLRRSLLSPEEGAQTSLYLAASPEVEGVSGRYFQACAEARSSEASRDPATAAALWCASEQLTGLAPGWLDA
jgi:NAD(P)-dependent dehydrogenase (short-subunit alcohol dehydrogenase family)